MFVFYYKSNISHLSYTRTDEDGAGAGLPSQTEETSPQKITMAAHTVTFNLYISDKKHRFLFLFSFLMLLLSYNLFYKMYLCVQMIKS